MNENINLDNIKPGLEEQYNALCKKEYDKFERYSKNFKKARIIIAILNILMIILLLNMYDKVDNKYKEYVEATVGFFFIGAIMGPFFIKDNRRKIANDVQEKLYQFIKPELYKSEYCPNGMDFQKEYRASMPDLKPYDGYTALNYYKYLLSDGTIVQGADITVSKRGEKEDIILFCGQLICLKNKIKVEKRIDILPDNEGPSTNINLDSRQFEEKFKVLCSDETYAYQIITSDIMNLIVDFYNNTDITCSIALEEDNIYIKLSGTNMNLYSNQLHNPFKKETVEHCCKQFKAIIDFTEEFWNNIETEM